METPAPHPTDPEDVVTALETAAIFAAKGDVPEAARWLGRAADFATLSGNGERAETFTRSARALSESRSDGNDALESPPPLPTPPARRASVRPMPPSERPAERDANGSSNSQPMLLVRPPSTTPSPPAARASTAPASGRSATPAPASVKPSPASVKPSPATSTPRPSVHSQGAAAVASSPSRTPAAPAVSASGPSAKENQEISAVRESSPRASAPPKPVETPKPTPKPSLHHELHRPFRLQGARVSISASQGSSRFYVLKVLEENEPVPPGEHEAFLVLADPNATR